MHHNCTHEYSVNAFRLYSRCGCPETEVLSQLELNDPAFLDLKAVDRTFSSLRGENDGADVMNCVREVYLRDPEELYHKGTVQLRVRRAGDLFSMSESTVYRNLGKACRLFARYRGLHDPDDEDWLTALFK